MKPVTNHGSSLGEATILAYGFDAAGYPIQNTPVVVDGVGRIEFVEFMAPVRFETADGVIVPQGIFEQIDPRRSGFGLRTDVRVHKSPLLERERQTFTLLQNGKWVCFLVDEIVDEVSQGFHLESIKDTDLCKRILNAFEIQRHHRYRFYIDHQPELRVREKEFASYCLCYGRPTMVFELPHAHPIERTVIAELVNKVVAFELDHQVFILPCHVSNKDWPTAQDLAKKASRAICYYRAERQVEIPYWVDDLKFQSEETLNLEINSLLEKVNRLESRLLSWRDYKSVLILSGKRLMGQVRVILESVFDLRVKLDETGISGMVSDDSNHPVLLIACQSSADEINRDCVDQALKMWQNQWSHESLRKVLFVNSHESASGITARARARIAPEVAHYASEHHVLMTHAMDLLFLLQQLENDLHRQTKLLHLLRLRGGWLEVNADRHSIHS